jgi:uncharacterized caspase-like protein
MLLFLKRLGWMMQIFCAVRAFFLAGLLVMASAAVSLAERRHALVVGIDEYDNVATLKKAVNDARAVKAALVTAGFEVQLVEGADQISFLEAIAAFSASIGPGDEAVVYYAGHGVEIDGRNYLLPSDVPAAAPGQEIVLTNRAISVEDLVDALQQRGARISLLILDACRDNPFPRSGTRSIGGTRGLAPAPNAEGTFILYSAGEGETALDRLSDTDPNPNSVFTRALVPLIAEPGLPLREVSRRVRSEVRQMAMSVDHAQFPAVYDQLDGDFSFTAASAGVAAAAADPCAAARADWALVAGSDSVAAINGFIAAYPACQVFQALAMSRLEEVAGGTPGKTAVLVIEKDGSAAPSALCIEADAAYRGTNAKDIPTLQQFLARYPDCGPTSERAQRALATLQGEAGEKALRLSRRDMAHISLALGLFSGERENRTLQVTTAEGTFLNFAGQQLLEGFARQRGLVAPDAGKVYLDRRIADALLAIEVGPQPASAPPGSNVDFSGVWTSSISDARCDFQGAATALSDRLVQTTPIFRAWASPDGKESSVTWDFVNPVPFDLKRPVAATLDGQPIGLSISAGQTVQPALYNAAEGRELNGNITESIAKGKILILSGTNELTGEPLSVTYTLDGFTAAFKRMAKLCKRPALNIWVE